jgi:hypothetical protein
MAKAIIEPRKILLVMYCMYSCFSISKAIQKWLLRKYHTQLNRKRYGSEGSVLKRMLMWHFLPSVLKAFAVTVEISKVSKAMQR